MRAETLRSTLGLILIMLLCYFLQSAVFSRLHIFGAAPLLLPLVAAAAGLLGSSGWGGAFGLLFRLRPDEGAPGGVGGADGQGGRAGGADVEGFEGDAVHGDARGRGLDCERRIRERRVGEDDVAGVRLAERDGHAIHERDLRAPVRPFNYFQQECHVSS